ncbi:hypothetical protein, partial [Oscillibacter sp. UBA6647]
QLIVPYLAVASAIGYFTVAFLKRLTKSFSNLSRFINIGCHSKTVLFKFGNKKGTIVLCSYRASH